MTTTESPPGSPDKPSIDDVLDAFLEERKVDKAASTYYNNKGHLEHFRGWCVTADISTMTELSPHSLLRYKLILKKDDTKNRTTVGNYFSSIRTFFTWANKYGYCDDNIPTAMESDEFSKSGNPRTRMIPDEQAHAALQYMEKFRYATNYHTIFTILWHTGCRRAALCGLDKEDWKPVTERKHGEYGLLDFNHRPDTDTPLKNDEGGEREVMIWPEYGEVIQDYIDTHRKNKTDEYGREPLLTSKKGRYKPNSIQPVVNAMTRPCKIGLDCPEGRDPDECEAAYFDHAARCPDSYSPHPLRRAAITHHLEEKNWTYEGASGRFDVSVDVLKKHYDQSTKEGRRRTRASMFFENGGHDEA
jgi:integrase